MATGVPEFVTKPFAVGCFDGNQFFAESKGIFLPGGVLIPIYNVQMEKQGPDKILSQFVNLESIDAFAPLSGGHINQTFRVDAVLAEGRRQKFLLQKINTVVFKYPEKVMENIAATAKHLSESNYGLKVMAPVRAKSGSWLLTVNNGAWRLFPFIENTVCYTETSSDELAHDAAWAFGHFMAKLANVEIGKLHLTIPAFHHGILRIKQLDKAAKDAQKGRLAQADGLLKEIREQLEYLKKIDSLSMPLRVVHHDAKISNVLFDEENNKPAAIIDLDTIMPGRMISDFGDLVRSMACTASEEEEDYTKVDFLPDRYEALEEGFLKGLDNGFTAEERAALPLAGPWLTLMQSTRYLTDYLAGDSYYQVRHEKQNYYRALNQYTLYKSMKSQLADRLIVC